MLPHLHRRQNYSYQWLIRFYFYTVKLANSASPFKFRQVKFQKKTGLENDKMSFSQRETEYNRRYRCQISTMHYGSISGMLRNDISLRDSILLQVKDVSLKDIKR